MTLRGLTPLPLFFDESKLFWLNERHIKSLPTEELGRLVQPFLKHQARKEELLSLIPPLLSGFKSLKQGGQILDLFLDEEFSIHESAREALLWPKSKVLLNKWLGFLKECSKNTLDMEDIKAFQKKIQAEDHIRGKEFFMPLRCALMGRPEGLEMKVLIGLYPKVRWIQRAERLLQQL